MALPNENDLLKKEHQDDEIEVHISDYDEGTAVEIVDDTPEADRNRTALPESEVEPSDEEMEEYSDKVKKRLSKMRHGIHDERRAKEAATRERDEAVAAAKHLLEEKKTLEARYTQGEDAFISQTKEKADMKMAQVKREYKEAYEIGDADAMADAQEKMANIAMEKRQADDWSRNAAVQRENARQSEAAVIQRQPSSPKVPEPDADAVIWAEKNKWFGQNKRMTNMAYAIHDEIVAEGIDPLADAPEYYKKLNAEIRNVFPSYEWGDTPKKKTITSVVASVNRTSKTTKRVTLTQSQVAVAKRLGVTPLEYARELAKLEN